MRPRSLATALAVLALAGCATSGEVRRLRARIAELEAQAEARRADDEAVRLTLEGKLLALQLELDKAPAPADGDALAALSARVDRLEKQRPSGAPSRPAPDPAAVYAVPVAGLPAHGPDDALVTIVRAGEYACPFCEKVRATLDALRSEYGDKLRLVYVSFVVHPQVATIPAQAACAAHRQGRFWDMDELLWEKAFKTRQFDQAHMIELATELGLDVARFQADLEGDCVRDVQQQMLMLSRFGVGATPGFFINGRFLSGAQPVTAFEQLIDEELAKAEARLASTAPKGARKGKARAKAPTYYDTWVLGQGLTKLATPTPSTP